MTKRGFVGTLLGGLVAVPALDAIKSVEKVVVKKGTVIVVKVDEGYCITDEEYDSLKDHLKTCFPDSEVVITEGVTISTIDS